MSSAKDMTAKEASNTGNPGTVSSVNPEDSATALSAQSWFHDFLLNECARRRAGGILPLPPGHPMGSHVFFDYSWAEEECINFEQNRCRPFDLSTVPSDKKCVILEVVSIVVDATDLNAAPRIQSDYSLPSGKQPYFLVAVPESSDAGHAYVIPSEVLADKSANDTDSHDDGGLQLGEKDPEEPKLDRSEASMPLQQLMTDAKAAELYAIPLDAFHEKLP